MGLVSPDFFASLRRVLNERFCGGFGGMSTTVLVAERYTCCPSHCLSRWLSHRRPPRFHVVPHSLSEQCVAEGMFFSHHTLRKVEP